MTDEKLREMAQEWFRERSEAWAATVMLAAGMRGPSHEERKRFNVRDRESVRALLQRVRDETRAERDHSIVKQWHHEAVEEIERLKGEKGAALLYLGDDCACDSYIEGGVNGLCDFCEIRLILKGEKP